MSSIREAERYSWTDYRGWVEGERWEFIDGAAYAMSPSPSRIHQHVAGNIYREISGFLKRKPCIAYHAPIDVKLSPPEADDRPTVLQPDVVVVCDPNRLREWGIQGAPDLVIEILSPSSARMDEVTKRRLYERYGIREYWIVHPSEHYIVRYVLKGDRFGAAHYYSAEDDVIETPILEGLGLRLADIFDLSGSPSAR